MGDTLNQVKLASFLDELETIEKEAGALDLARRGASAVKAWAARGRHGVQGTPQKAITGVGNAMRGFQKNLSGVAERVIHPVQGLKKGVKDMTPRAKMQDMSPLQREKFLRKGFFGKPGQHLHGASGLKNESLLQTMRGRTADAASKGRLKATAEELSRRGWTGQGNVTKYMPVGGKGQMALMTAPAIPGVVKAMGKDTGATGEGGGAERGLGELGGLGGWIAGSGLGLPGMALWAGGQAAGEYGGRILDRMRGGASLGTATSAPSRQEAIGQLQNIQRYHS